MNHIVRSLRSVILALSLAVSAPACMGGADDVSVPFPDQSRPVEARVTLDEALELARVTLSAFNEGDYARFSARWTQEMRSAIDAEDFGAFRAESLARYGRFASILEGRVTPGTTAGNVRFSFRCQFERGELIYFIAFRVDGTEVVGVQLAPQSSP